MLLSLIDLLRHWIPSLTEGGLMKYVTFLNAKRIFGGTLRRLVCLLFVLILSGCTPTQNAQRSWAAQTDALRILCTLSMIEDLVTQVGGEHVACLTLIRGELDPHSYELVKGDDEKFACADLIFYNGLGLEHGYSLRQNLEGNPKAVAVADVIAQQMPDAILETEGQKDPHIWMDISLWAHALDPIVSALSEKDPDHAEDFQKRADGVRAQLAAADDAARRRLLGLPGEKRYLVTSHDAFHYFTRRYLADEPQWQERCAAPEGLAPEAQMSVHDLQEILEHVTRYQVGVLFPESNVNRAALEKLVSAARDKGMHLRLSEESLYGDAMGEATSYVDMMSHNVEVIYKELSQ